MFAAYDKSTLIYMYPYICTLTCTKVQVLLALAGLATMSDIDNLKLKDFEVTDFEIDPVEDTRQFYPMVRGYNKGEISPDFKQNAQYVISLDGYIGRVDTVTRKINKTRQAVKTFDSGNGPEDIRCFILRATGNKFSDNQWWPESIYPCQIWPCIVRLKHCSCPVQILDKFDENGFSYQIPIVIS